MKKSITFILLFAFSFIISITCVRAEEDEDLFSCYIDDHHIGGEKAYEAQYNSKGEFKKFFANKKEIHSISLISDFHPTSEKECFNSDEVVLSYNPNVRDSIVKIQKDDSYVCNYDAKFAGNSGNADVRNGSVIVSPINNRIYGWTEYYNLKSSNFVLENVIKDSSVPVVPVDRFYSDSGSDADLISNYLKDGDEYLCPNQVYVCEGFSGPTVRVLFVIFNADIWNKIPVDNDGISYIDTSETLPQNNHSTTQENILPPSLSSLTFKKNVNCTIATYTEEGSTAKPNDIQFACEKYQEYTNKLKDLYCNLGSDSDCKVEDIEEYNAKKDEFIGYCRAKSSYVDYLNPCGQSCLNIKSTIAEIEGTSTTDNGNNCGFSERIVVFINNILKWVKYIIPAIVVVLGIIDFIKAIVSDKDDEMKKAQGRFVKRLIAAALIFIIPFIIGFILDKMGFTAESCGIIKELE